MASGYMVFSTFGTWGERGAVGDMFGSINALFSGFALCGVIYAIFLQRKELELQREELKLTREELKKSAKAQQKISEDNAKIAEFQSESAKTQLRGVRLQAEVELFNRLSALNIKELDDISLFASLSSEDIPKLNKKQKRRTTHYMFMQCSLYNEAIHLGYNCSETMMKSWRDRFIELLKHKDRLKDYWISDFHNRATPEFKQFVIDEMTKIDQKFVEKIANKTGERNYFTSCGRT